MASLFFDTPPQCTRGGLRDIVHNPGQSDPDGRALRDYPERERTYAAGQPIRTVPSTRSTREIGVYTQPHCPVTATESTTWIRIESAPTFGSGEIVVRIDENPDNKERSGPITITGENFSFVVTIVQEGKD